MDDFVLSPPHSHREEEDEDEEINAETIQPSDEQNLYLLTIEFLGYLRRVKGVPYAKGDLGRRELHQFILDRHYGRLEYKDSMFESAVRDINKRQAQANRAHEIAKAALARTDRVLLGGDLNDVPHSPPLAALFADGFADVITHPNWPQDRPGTYDTGLESEKFYYLIMPPQLQAKLHDVGIERRGSYHPMLWAHFNTVDKKIRSLGSSSGVGGF